jgi:chromosome segregation protein
VHLDKLEIFGFKSFAHKLSLEFGPGITGVVGPNGCGKTNIADAIRWVLGEQSASELRGASMSDVIFNGTKKRKRLGRAEVTLTIDNSAGYLPIDYSEILIGRKVYRSGESEYSINKSICRLRDIHDLFLDTGIGTRTYSLIERKMVDSVLSDSAGHRRFMFEEAAGIMKYKVRKRSALNKLNATESDMQRVADIIGEVEKQVRSLKRQLSQARRHRRYTDELKGIEILLARHDYAEWEQVRNGSRERAVVLRQKLSALDEVLNRDEETTDAIRAELRGKDQVLGTLDGEIAEFEDRMRNLADGLLVTRERVRSSQSRAEELDLEATDARADLSASLEKAERLEAEVKSAAAAVDELGAELVGKSKLLESIEKEHRILQRDVAGQKQTRLKGLESSAGIKGELESFRARLDDLMREHVEIEAALATARAELSEKETRILEALEEEKLLIHSSGTARADEKANSAGLDRAREELLSAREREARVGGELASARHKLELLTEIRDGYGGYQDGVRALLSDRSHEIAGLLGTVGDILNVEPSMARALEAALAGTVQYVVTNDVSSARAGIAHLADGELGRATFIPLSELDSVIHRRIPNELLSSDGVLGSCEEFVRCADEHGTLASFLLEGAVVVEDLDRAADLARRFASAGLAFVTRNGEMVSSSGLLGGGRVSSNDAGLLRRTERVENARHELARLESELAAAMAAVSKHSSNVEHLSSDARSAGALVEQAEADLWDAKRKVTELELARTSIAERADELAGRRDGLAQRMMATRTEIGGIAQRLAGLSKGEDEAGERLHVLQRSFEDAEKAKERALEAQRAAEIGVASSLANLRQLRAERMQLAEAATTVRSAIERRTAERSEQIRIAEELASRIEEDHDALGRLRVKRDELTSQRESTRAETHSRRAKIEKITDANREARESRERLQRELHEIELRETELRGRSEALAARTREDYGIELADTAAYDDTAEDAVTDLDAARQEVERIKVRLRSMGPVNLLALDEYDEESKRLQFLKAQYEDLEKSRTMLTEAIEEINVTAKEMFVQTFELVRGNFAGMFARLFEGGEADLRLLEPNDPLNSAIEIVASPREKKLGRLSLLSGGERALTAIALLFAIYLVKPSPFCILDEVDAPLDDANVKRFIRMLREFSDRTQFIIISHNKVTMEATDRLYGVTMEESGVSKVVSVRLDGMGNEVRSEEIAYETV